MTDSSSYKTPQTLVDLREAVAAAARWYARLNSAGVSEADQLEWTHWLEQSPSHRQAWREVEQVQARFSRVPGHIAAPALRGADISRRELLRRLGVFAAVAPVAFVAWRAMPWQQWRAEYSTATGERQQFTLEDGSLLALDTNSAADVLYSGASRLVRLYRGEVLIETASDSFHPSRPFRVETPQGRVDALETRLVVRSESDKTTVTVLNRAELNKTELDKAVLSENVRVTSADGRQTFELHCGQQMSIGATHGGGIQAGAVQPADIATGTWLNGSLVAVDMALGTLVEELARYRHGVLCCDPAIAALKVSGAFPVDDTETALEVLSDTFPIRQQRVSRYWVKIVAA